MERAGLTLSSQVSIEESVSTSCCFDGYAT